MVWLLSMLAMVASCTSESPKPEDAPSEAAQEPVAEAPHVAELDAGILDDLRLGREDVGGGRFIPSTAADQFAATLAKWFGIPDVDLDLVAPHIDNFMQRDLGFMV